jgi:hypothetical protein
MDDCTNEAWSVSRYEFMDHPGDTESRCPRCAIWEVVLFNDIDEMFAVRSWTGLEDRGVDWRVCDWHLKKLLQRDLTHVIYVVDYANEAERLNAECEEAGQWPDRGEPMRRLEELMAFRKEGDEPPPKKRSGRRK